MTGSTNFHVNWQIVLKRPINEMTARQFCAFYAFSHSHFLQEKVILIINPWELNMNTIMSDKS